MLAFTSLCTTAVLAASLCGELHREAGFDYALATTQSPARALLLLLVGGGGHLNLDDQACPRALRGNLLVRIQPALQAAGFVTVLVDAPAEWQGEDGLAGHRAEPAHAAQLERLADALRTRHPALPLWLMGTSRGTISAVNAATRWRHAPELLVLVSPLLEGNPGARRSWVSQTVFELPLETLRVPTLLVGHAGDACLRSPPSRLPELLQRVGSARKRSLLVGQGPAAPVTLAACEGRSPHGLMGEESALIQAIQDFGFAPDRQ